MPTPAFWVVAAGNAVHFGDHPLERGQIRDPELEPDGFSPDRDTPAAAYVSPAGSGRIAGIELRDGQPTVTARRDLGGDIEQVESKAKEEFRVFVAGNRRLCVLAYESLEVLATVYYGQVLSAAGLEAAQVADIVVGDLYIYLPIEDEPYLLRVHKPSE